MNITIFTDGGSRSNPGKAAIGIVVKHNDDTIHADAKYLGIATNNEAEYEALLFSLEWVLKQTTHSVEQITWKLDSKLVVEQVSRRWKIKEARLQQFAQKIWVGLEQLSVPYSIKHVPRAENKEADALVNQTLDSLN